MELLEQMIEFVAQGSEFIEEKKENGTQKPTTTEVIIKKPKSKRQFDEEIDALSVFYPITEGSTIEIQLHDLLVICPRERERVDAYRGLVSELAKKGITLIIKSRKTK